MTLRVVAMFVLAVLTGCAGHVHLPGGHDVGMLMDHEIGDAIAASYPQLDVGRAQCPFLLNLSWGRQEDCTIAVDGLPLHVTVFAGQHFAEFKRVDAVFVAQAEETKERRRLRRQYDAEVSVRCDGAPVRLIRAPAECSVIGRDGAPRSVAIAPPGLPGYPAGGTEIDGMPTLEERFFGAGVAAQRTGSATLRGSDVERYIGATLHLLPDGAAREVADAIRCPPRMTVRDGTSASCAVVFGSTTLPYSVRFEEGRGVFVEPEHAAYDLAALAGTVHRMVERRAARLKISVASTITCGNGNVLVFDPGAQVRCLRQITGLRAPDVLLVRFLDEGGTLSVWRKHDLDILNGP
ncbi:MAG TPA: hypothetical protein VGN14_00645 [Candidatus Elarobacter sp.]